MMRAFGSENCGGDIRHGMSADRMSGERVPGNRASGARCVGKDVGVHIVLGQAKLCQLVEGAVHHIGRTTSEHLHLAQVGEIFMNHLINPASTAIPVVSVLLDDGMIMEVLVVTRPLLRQLAEVKTNRRTV